MAPGGEGEAGAGTVHRLERVAALIALAPAFGIGLDEEHVLAVVVPVARAVPELLVEDPRGLDLDVAALVELRSHLALDQPQQHGPLRQPERHPRGLLAEAEQVELRAELAVIVLAGELELGELVVELRLGMKGGPVDPGQHLAALVAAPVGAGDRVQLERLDPPGRGSVRAAAQVGERPVAIQGHGFHALVADEVVDQLDLVGLIGGAKALQRLVGAHVLALERLIGGDVLAHRRLDPFEVGLARALAVGELEVVVEAALDRRPDRDLRPRPQVDDRRRHHVGGVVADQPQRVGRLVALAGRGDDPDLGAVRQLRAEVAQLAVDLDPERVLGEARPDRRGGVGAAGARRELERRPVRQLDRDRRHRRDATHAGSLR